MKWLKVNSSTYNRMQYSSDNKVVFYYLSPKSFIPTNDYDINYNCEVVSIGVNKTLCDYDLKQLVINIQKEYDKSDDVNCFIFNGKKYWFDKDTRLGLINSLNVQENIGQTTTTLWIGNISVNVSIEYIREFLKNLELYAIECFNVTQTHLNEINSIDNRDELFEYNITTSYPEPIEFDSNEIINE